MNLVEPVSIVSNLIELLVDVDTLTISLSRFISNNVFTSSAVRFL